jgi:hypothetical protein
MDRSDVITILGTGIKRSVVVDTLGEINRSDVINLFGVDSFDQGDEKDPHQLTGLAAHFVFVSFFE